MIIKYVADETFDEDGILRPAMIAWYKGPGLPLDDSEVARICDSHERLRGLLAKAREEKARGV